MAVTVGPQGNAGWSAQRLTLGNATLATRLEIDPRLASVLITTETASVRVSYDGTDGAALTASYIVLPPNTALRIFVQSQVSGLSPVRLLFVAGDSVNAAALGVASEAGRLST